MPVPPATNRQRIDRFDWNRDYFHAPTRLERRRTQLCVLAFVLAGGWLALGWIVLPEERRQLRYTHGPVANPHVLWEQRCEACHVPSSIADLSLTGLPDVHSRWHKFSCESCHRGSESDPKNYAPHHADAVWSSGAGTDCGRCHREHQGRDASLVRLPDRDCTQCHSDLSAHHARGEPKYAPSIKSFLDGHPDFRAVEKKDLSRTLSFNHAHHLMPGIPLSEDAARNRTNGAWKIGDLPEQFRERYRQPGQNDEDPVQLNCASCHQLDAAKSYYLPVTYENSCRACHPIETGPLSLPEAKINLKSLSLPHRVESDRLNELLDQQIVGELAKTKLPKTAPIDKKSRDRLDPLAEEQLKELRNLDDIVKKLAEQARQRLALVGPTGEGGGMSCGKCHQLSDKDGGAIIVAPVTPPKIWMPHARFNHAAHQSMACAVCHPGKQDKITDDAGQLRIDLLARPEPLDLPGIESCRQCHAPAQRVKVDGVPQMRGGVRHGCVDCHRYHHGEAPNGSGLDMEAILKGMSKGSP